MPHSERRLPDYTLKAKNRETEKAAPIGAGWLNEDGWITITINPFVSIPAGADIAFTLFPTETEGPHERPRAEHTATRRRDDADIPFDDGWEQPRAPRPRPRTRTRPARPTRQRTRG